MSVVRNKVFFRGGIFTAGELRRLGRRLNHRIGNVDAALQAMRQGEVLCLQYSAGRPCWSLSNGRAVSVEVANILINNASISPADGALFPDCVPAQTWKLGGING